jgi:hypothetical protein
MVDDGNAEDFNPYASPKSVDWDPSLSESTGVSQPERTTAWRQGDVLIVPRKGAVLPRACLISNSSSGVLEMAFATFVGRSRFLLLLLLLLPFVGFFCAILCALVLLRVGCGARVRFWLRWWIALPLAICTYIAEPLAFVGNVITGISIITRSVPLCLVGGVCLAVSVTLDVVPEKLMTRLKFDFKGGNVVYIRGVHRDYLDRLPELDADGIRSP